jgi:hypothetical protein
MTTTTETTITDELGPLLSQYAAERKVLRERVTVLQDEHNTLRRRLLPGIKSAAERTTELRVRIRESLLAHRTEFDAPRPRTVTLFGVKAGFQKAKGKITFADADSVVEKIKKFFPNQLAALVALKETPDKAGLAELSAADLKRLGCAIVGSGDEVIIKTPADEIDKLVDALLNAGDEEGGAS